MARPFDGVRSMWPDVDVVLVGPVAHEVGEGEGPVDRGVFVGGCEFLFGEAEVTGGGLQFDASGPAMKQTGL